MILPDKNLALHLIIVPSSKLLDGRKTFDCRWRKLEDCQKSTLPVVCKSSGVEEHFLVHQAEQSLESVCHEADQLLLNHLFGFVDDEVSSWCLLDPFVKTEVCGENHPGLVWKHGNLFTALVVKNSCFNKDDNLYSFVFVDFEQIVCKE